MELSPRLHHRHQARCEQVSTSRKVNPMAESFRPKTLKPRLAALNTNRVKLLETKAGATPRLRGDTWMKIRRDVLVEGGFTCVDCGQVSMSNEIDHEVPLEQGGGNDKANLRIRCIPCHSKKSVAEHRARYGK